MKRKGRNQKGSVNGNAKLTEVEVIAIREADRSETNQSELARKYGVTRQMVSLIIQRKSWSHVK